MNLKWILIAVCSPSMQAAHCQVDTTERFLFGWQLHWGIAQQDLSSLHKYGYMLGRPQKISFSPIFPSASLCIGNPNKLFVSLDMSFRMGMPKRGAYNNHSIEVSTSGGSFGANTTFPLRSYSNKKLKGLYIFVGAGHIRTSISSKARGPSPSLRDTTFHYEASLAESTALRGGVLLEFSGKGRPNNWDMPRFMVRAGYNLQLGQPKWSGTFTRDPNDGSSPVNLGGFTLEAGMNFWLRKGPRASSKTDTAPSFIDP